MLQFAVVICVVSPCELVDYSGNVMAHGNARKGK